MSTDAHMLLALLLTPGNGPATVNRIRAAVAQAGISLSQLAGLSSRHLLEVLPPGDGKLVSAIMACGVQHRDEAAHLLDTVCHLGVNFLTADAPEYPSCLTRFLADQAPPVLFVRGKKQLLHRPAVAIVGACHATPVGAKLAEVCATHFVDCHCTVVSGGAIGIDTVAHETTLSHGGNTVVVLPMGILTYTPPSYLQDALDEGRACVISQFLPRQPWATHAAVTRNAVIATLARIVCALEPRRSGGSIRTAMIALRQRKPVFAHCLPGNASVDTMLNHAGVISLTLPGTENLDTDRIDAAWGNTESGAADPQMNMLF